MSFGEDIAYGLAARAAVMSLVVLVVVLAIGFLLGWWLT